MLRQGVLWPLAGGPPVGCPCHAAFPGCSALAAWWRAAIWLACHTSSLQHASVAAAPCSCSA
eukprot:5589257-Alexandrium_andersonii.AAC.1